MKTAIKITALAVITVLAAMACTPGVDLASRNFEEVRSANNPNTNLNFGEFAPWVANLDLSFGPTTTESDKEFYVVFPCQADVLKKITKEDIEAELNKFLKISGYTNPVPDPTAALTPSTIDSKSIAYEFVRRDYGDDEEILTLRMKDTPTHAGIVARIDASQYTYSKGYKMDNNDDGTAGDLYDDVYEFGYPSVAGATLIDAYGDFIKPVQRDWVLTLNNIESTPISNGFPFTTAESVIVATLSGNGLDWSDNDETKALHLAVLGELKSKVKFETYDKASGTWKAADVTVNDPRVASSLSGTVGLLATYTPADQTAYRISATGLKDIKTTAQYCGAQQKIKVIHGEGRGTFRKDGYTSGHRFYYDGENKWIPQDNFLVSSFLRNSDRNGKNVVLQIFVKAVYTGAPPMPYWPKSMDKNTFLKNFKLVYNKTPPPDDYFPSSLTESIDNLVFIPIQDVKIEDSKHFDLTQSGNNLITLTLDPAYQIDGDRKIAVLLAPGFQYGNDNIYFGDITAFNVTIDGVTNWKLYTYFEEAFPNL